MKPTVETFPGGIDDREVVAGASADDEVERTPLVYLRSDEIKSEKHTDKAVTRPDKVLLPQLSQVLCNKCGSTTRRDSAPFKESDEKKRLCSSLVLFVSKSAMSSLQSVN